MEIFGVGTDIVECLRIAQMIERHADAFIGRIYTDAEIRFCTARKAATQHYAGRFAAKAAVLQALGTGWRRGVNWRDIEIRQSAEQRPTVALRGGIRDLIEQLEVQEIQISIAHCRTHATAMAMAIASEE